MANILYLLYDGDCILCRNSAQAIKIKQSIGKLEIINARSGHALVKEAVKNGYDLNEGILVKYHGQYFFGCNALHFLALVSSPSDSFNKLNAILFKSKILAACSYPIFKFFRNILLLAQGISPISNQNNLPLIQLIYGPLTNHVPTILQKRYSNRPRSNDYLLLKGEMSITLSRTFRIMSPFFRLAGALVPYAATNIPVTVELTSNSDTNTVMMHRTFFYNDRLPYHFFTRVIHIKDNMVIEKMRFGLCAKLIFTLDKNKIVMNYGGYAIHVGKWLIPIPLGFVIGKFYSFEEANNEDSFIMEDKMVHPLMGTIFQYDGWFKVEETL